MKVLWFNGNFGNQIFYCAYKDYLADVFPCDIIYAYIDEKCPPVKVEERTNLHLPKISFFIDILSFFVFKVAGVIFRRIPIKFLPGWYCGRGALNDKACFFDNSMQNKLFYENKPSNWLEIKEPAKLEDDYLKWKFTIANNPSVCIHIRRGDYVKPGSAYVDLLSTDYYLKALAYAKSILPNALYFFFSDDLEYVRTVFRGENIYYVDCNKGDRGYLDIVLMSLAKINIMANSTFSYWASYIAHENKTVIYPKRWFCDWTHREAPDIMLNRDNWIGF